MCCVQNVLAGGPPSRRRQARRTPLPRAMTTAGSLREQPCDQAGRAHSVASVAQHPLGTPAVTALPAASVGEAGQRANLHLVTRHAVIGVRSMHQLSETEAVAALVVGSVGLAVLCLAITMIVLHVAG